MRENQRRAWLWLFPTLWAGLIFVASADTESSTRSSRLIGPLVRWLFPEASAETIDLTIFTVRKAAHAIEYAILAVLLRLALHGNRPSIRSVTTPAPWAVALLITAFYAASDEIHQAWVPGRTGAITDVFLDVLGAAAGLFLVEQCSRWRQRRRTHGAGGNAGGEG